MTLFLRSQFWTFVDRLFVFGESDDPASRATGSRQKIGGVSEKNDKSVLCPRALVALPVTQENIQYECPSCLLLIQKKVELRTYGVFSFLNQMSRSKIKAKLLNFLGS